MSIQNLHQFYKIIKSVKKLSFDDLVYNLKEALSKAQKQAEKDFLIQCLTCLNEKKMAGKLEKEDISFIESQVEQTLGASVETLAKKPFMSAIVDAYGRGKRKTLNKFKMDYSLGDNDLGALQALQDFNCWWVREKVINQTNDIIQNLAKETLESGATRLQFADKLEKALLNDVKETKQYFDLLADHVLTKTQNMGHVAGYEEAGVEHVKIVAVLDQKTSQICRAMNGRIFEVKGFRKQYDNIISAAKKRDIDGVKAAQPMLNSETAKKISNMTSTKEFKALGFKMPPYHFHCRTTHVAYFMPKKIEVYDAKEKGVLGDFPGDKQNLRNRTKDFANSFTIAEIQAKIDEQKNKAQFGRIKYNSNDLNQDLDKHSVELGIKPTKAELEKICNETVARAKNVCLNIWRETGTEIDTMQYSYFDGERIVVVGENGDFRCAVSKQNKADLALTWKNWKLNRGRVARGIKNDKK